MQIDFAERTGALIISPRFPRLDAVASPKFRELTVERVASKKHVIVDMHDVQAMDSTGLGSLISLLKRMPPGGQLYLVAPSKEVHALLKLTRLDRVLRWFDTVDAALAA